MIRTHSVLVAVVATCGLAWAMRADADDWPQWRGPLRDGVWRETGLLEQFPDRQLQWKWHVPIGTGYCGPTVAAGRVYVMDRQQDPEQERVLCLDAETGRELWRHAYGCEYQRVSYTAGPRASVTLADGQAFALGTMGHLHCLEAASGQLLWQRDLGTDYQIRLPQWGIAAAPLVHRDLVIVQIGGRPGACVVALDRQSGQERWRALEDRAGYSAPILLNRAGTTVCVAWTGDSIAGLDADQGRVLWRLPFTPRKMPIGVATPVYDGDRIFVSSFYDGSFMVQLGTSAKEARKLWSAAGPSERQTEALHCMISTPIMRDGLIWGVDSYGELRCLEAATGQRLWEERSRHAACAVEQYSHGDARGPRLDVQ